MRARVVDGQFQFKLCQEFEATEFEVLAAGPNDGVNYTLRWSQSGTANLSRDTVITYGTPLPGWTEHATPRRLDPERDTVSVHVSNPQKSDVAVFTAGQVTSEWTAESGAQQDCA